MPDGNPATDHDANTDNTSKSRSQRCNQRPSYGESVESESASGEEQGQYKGQDCEKWQRSLLAKQ